MSEQENSELTEQENGESTEEPRRSYLTEEPRLNIIPTAATMDITFGSTAKEFTLFYSLVDKDREPLSQSEIAKLLFAVPDDLGQAGLQVAKMNLKLRAPSLGYHVQDFDSVYSGVLKVKLRPIYDTLNRVEERWTEFFTHHLKIVNTWVEEDKGDDE